jgi:integrase
MKQRLRLFKRGKVFYYQDTETGQQLSLETRQRGEAVRLLEMKRQSLADPGFRRLLVKTCLASLDPLLVTRNWQAVMDQMLTHGKDSTKARCQRAMSGSCFNALRDRKLLDSTAEDFLAILNSCRPSVNHYLRRLHNLALGLGWLPVPILPSKLWPKPRFKEKRAITFEEHQRILGAEKNAERHLFYQLLWEMGASQSDAAELKADQIDWTHRTLSFQRKKTGSWSQLVIGRTLERILKQLPTEGFLFPSISQTSANDRAAEFCRRCKILKISGVSLHSYRYAWAERAKVAGYPERFAQLALGHNSKAVHRAYAKRAQVTLPALEDFETRTATGIMPLPALEAGAPFCKPK